MRKPRIMRIRCAASTLVALSCFAVQALTSAPVVAQPAKAPHAKPSPHEGHAAQKAAIPAGKPRKGGKHLATRKAGDAGEPDDAIRRAIAGTGRVVREAPELRAMRELDLALFPSAAPSSGAPWTAQGTPLILGHEPKVVASGMPPSTALAPLPAADPVQDLSWLRGLAMPDIPVRWDARVIRYLEYYRNNARGRSMVASWLRKSGRYGSAIRRVLREQGMPEDIVWLSLVESGFDPTIQSPVGAAGLWQFMPEGARIYGLTVDRWIDERLDPERSTIAAARYLTDLRQRFGGWELAFAAYNMGYGGLLSSIRKYNTNDFWELSRVESGMPLETALYVPKIVAIAIVAKNRAAFGLDNIELDPAVGFDKVAVSPGVSLQSIALAAGTTLDKVSELNPQFLANRAPPGNPAVKLAGSWTVRVPPGSAAKTAKSLPAITEVESKVDRYVVRWGEALDDIAARRGTTRGTLVALNGLRRDEVLRPGTVLLVPANIGGDPYSDLPATRPVVVVPAQTFTLPGRRRVFYRVIPGDTLRNVAALFAVSADDLSHWNAIDATASLHDGMTLQVFAPPGLPKANVQVLDAKDAHVLAVGSKEFFAHFEGHRGRTRIEILAKQGDTWRTLAHRYGLSVAQLERINGRGRTTPLDPGDRLVVYVDSAKIDPRQVTPKPEEQAPDTVQVAALPHGDGEGVLKDEGAAWPAVLLRVPDARGPTSRTPPGTAAQGSVKPAGAMSL